MDPVSRTTISSASFMDCTHLSHCLDSLNAMAYTTTLSFVREACEDSICTTALSCPLGSSRMATAGSVTLAYFLGVPNLNGSGEMLNMELSRALPALRGLSCRCSRIDSFAHSRPAPSAHAPLRNTTIPVQNSGAPGFAHTSITAPTPDGTGMLSNWDTSPTMSMSGVMHMTLS